MFLQLITEDGNYLGVDAEHRVRLCSRTTHHDLAPTTWISYAVKEGRSGTKTHSVLRWNAALSLQTPAMYGFSITRGAATAGPMASGDGFVVEPLGPQEAPGASPPVGVNADNRRNLLVVPDERYILRAYSGAGFFYLGRAGDEIAAVSSRDDALVFRHRPFRAQCHLQAADGRWVVVEAETSEVRANRPRPGPWEVLTLLELSDAARGQVRPRALHHLEGFALQGWTGGIVQPSPAGLRADGTTLTANGFRIYRMDGAGEVKDGDTIALLGNGGWLTAHDPSGPAGPNASLSLVPAVTPTRWQRFRLHLTRPLFLFRDASADTYRTVGSWDRINEARDAGLESLGVQGRVHIGPFEGAVPLNHYLGRALTREDRTRGVTSFDARATLASGEMQWQARRVSMREHGVEGWIHASPTTHTIPIKLYQRDPEGDIVPGTFSGWPRLALAASPEDERRLSQEGYTFERVEGHVDVPDARDHFVLSGIDWSRYFDLLPFLDPPGSDDDMPPSGGGTGGGTGGGLTGHQLDPEVARRFRLGRDRWVDLGDVRIRDRIRLGRRRIKALVLSGGGAKGSFQVGVARKLWEQGYRPDVICGVSVGAVNGTKLAEGDGAAQELWDLWARMSRPTSPAGSTAGPLTVWNENVYLDRIKDELASKIPEMIASATAGGAAAGLVAPLLPPDPLIQVAALLAGLFGGAGLDAYNEATSLLRWFHAMHSMRPLREHVLPENMRLDRLRRSDIALRIGMTDSRTGRFLTVSGPDLDETGPVAYGRVDPEPDHHLGEDIWTRPPFGATGWKMRLIDAIYSSAMLPVFMDALYADMSRTTVTADGFALLELGFPPGIRRLLSDRGETSWPTHMHGASSPVHPMFDGGLRDQIPIRTALRLGARDITVVTGDQLQTSRWNLSNPEQDLMHTPAIQYLVRLLGVWANDGARNDMMTVLATNESFRWLRRAFDRLSPPEQLALANEFNAYWQSRGDVWKDALGAAMWLGGNEGFRVSDAPPTFNPEAEERGAFGIPLHDEGATIRYIAPDREIVDPLGFSDWEKIEEAMHLGYELGDRAVELSRSALEP